MVTEPSQRGMHKMINKRSKNINFIDLHGWMVNELNLKNNNLIIYAIIYGFSKKQGGNGFFSGSREYLASWTSSTIRGVQKNLNYLVDNGLIIKGTFNGKTVYKPNENILHLEMWTSEEYIYGEQSSMNAEQVNNIPVWSEPNSFNSEHSSLLQGEHSSPNNIDIYNSNNNIDYNRDIYNADFASQVACIIDYLNKKADTRFKASSKKTKSLIHARIKDGFNVEDFYTVIDKKCEEWMDTEFEKFLRPETLFGTKFEGYLNQKARKEDLFSQILKGEKTIYDENGNDISIENAESGLSFPF